MIQLDPYIRRLRPLLKLGTKIAPMIPSRQDTWWQTGAKILALLDSTNDIYGSGQSKMRELADRYSLVERESETFVRLFFATTLRDHFTLKRQQLDDRVDLIEAVGPGGERLFFRETHYGSSRIESDFYVSPSVDFAKVIDTLWASYPDGIYLSVTVEPGGWKKDTTILGAPPLALDRLSRAARERLAVAENRHRSFAFDGVHRCYLLYGKRGTGKSSFASLFARKLGGRALKFDATSLPQMSVKEFGFLLDVLKPRFLVIDDMDRAPVSEVGARMLFLLERLKTHYPGMTVLLSVNDPSKLDSALLRCGRIDIPIAFDPPEKDEVEQMVHALLKEHAVPAWRATGAVVTRIAEEAVAGDLTHAYLADLCQRLRHEDVDDVLASVKLLNELAEQAQAAAAAPAGKPIALSGDTLMVSHGTAPN